MTLDVIRQSHSKQYQVEDEAHIRHWLRISPYKTLDNQTEGAVISVLESGESAAPGRNSPRKSAKKKKKS